MSPQEIAQSRREAMRLRARRIRRAVAGLAMALFSAAFLTVYVQLASGHDPALTAAAKRRAGSTAASAPRQTEASSETGEYSRSQEEASVGEEAATGESPSSVTSRQS